MVFMHLFSIQQQLIVPMAIVAKCKNGKTSIKLVNVAILSRYAGEAKVQMQ